MSGPIAHAEKYENASTANRAAAQKIESQPPWVISCAWASSCGAAVDTQEKTWSKSSPQPTALAAALKR